MIADTVKPSVRSEGKEQLRCSFISANIACSLKTVLSCLLTDYAFCLAKSIVHLLIKIPGGKKKKTSRATVTAGGTTGATEIDKNLCFYTINTHLGCNNTFLFNRYPELKTIPGRSRATLLDIHISVNVP